MAHNTEVHQRVAMFVLNPCHSDARVRKEAASLGAAGYEVRVFGLGNSTWPEAVIDEGDFTIHRLEVRSVYQRIIAGLGAMLRRRPAPANGDADQPPARRGVRRLLHLAGLFLRTFIRGIPRALALVLGAVWRLVASLVMLVLSPILTLGWRLLDRTLPHAAEGLRQDLAAFAARAVRVRRRIRVRGRRAGRAVGRRVAAVRQAPRNLPRRLLRALRGWARRRLIILHRPSVHMAYWDRAHEAALAWQPDAVHGHDLNGLPAAARVAKDLDIPMVYDSHELWRHRNKVHGHSPVSKLGDMLTERRLIKRCAAVITVGDRIGEWLSATYALPDGRVHIVRNVPVARVGEAAETTVDLRADHPALTDRRILLYTGRITTGRGIEEAIEALARTSDGVAFALLGYGDPEYVGSVTDLAAKLGVQDRVVVVPPVPSHQVAAVAAQADAAIVAVKPICLSYRFALPNKLFEAIQGHLPVVATDLPEMGAIVRRHGCGELYEPGDTAALSKALEQVLDDPTPYREAARRAAAELTWENESTVLLDLYADLLPLHDQRLEPAVPGGLTRHG